MPDHVVPGQGACLIGLTASPCPFHGGPVPPLDHGPPAGSYTGLDPIASVPGPGASAELFGECAECGAVIMADDEGRPVSGLLRGPAD